MTWYDSDWNKRRKITVDSAKVAGDLTDWPLVFHASNEFPDAQASGDDFVFAKPDGTKLSHEIQSYDSDLWAHVKLPSVTAGSDTELYVYYDNPSAGNQETPADVWTNSFAGVYHLIESKSGTDDSAIYADSTSNDNHGTDHVSASGSAGVIGDGQEFETSNDDYVGIDQPFGFTPDEYTISFWVRTNDGTIQQFPVNMRNDIENYWQVSIKYGVSDNEFSVYNGGDYAKLGTIADDQWTHLTFKPVSGDIVAFKNGSQSGTTGNKHRDTSRTGRSAIGDYVQDGGFALDGNVDELRVSPVVRSDAWISTTYENQTDPGSFYTLGGEELNNTAVRRISKRGRNAGAVLSASNDADLQSRAHNGGTIR
jgi:MSHA biogenesis protein MshQ